MANTKTIFVFGSNLAGRHGKGAALYAKMYYGAINGQGIGIQGSSYAIPTKDGRNGASLGRADQILSLQVIKGHVDKFVKYAKANPDTTFKVTAIGTGFAGYTHDEIGSMFYHAPLNCILPAKWRDVLPYEEGRQFWIT